MIREDLCHNLTMQMKSRSKPLYMECVREIYNDRVMATRIRGWFNCGKA